MHVGLLSRCGKHPQNQYMSLLRRGSFVSVHGACLQVSSPIGGEVGGQADHVHRQAPNGPRGYAPGLEITGHHIYTHVIFKEDITTLTKP